jgi:hypothetical protein
MSCFSNTLRLASSLPSRTLGQHGSVAGCPPAGRFEKGSAHSAATNEANFFGPNLLFVSDQVIEKK